MNTAVLTLPISLMLLAANCAPAVQRGTQSERSLEQRRASSDTIVRLWLTFPCDSVVLRRGQATILLSMRDVSAYFNESPLPPDMASLYDEIRGDFERAGWVHLREGMLEDLLASRLIEQGHASIRLGSPSRTIPWVRLALENTVAGTTVIVDRLFYTPDGILLLRVPYGVTVS